MQRDTKRAWRMLGTVLVFRRAWCGWQLHMAHRRKRIREHRALRKILKWR